MVGSFLDTTVVVHLADKENADHENSNLYIKSNQPVHIPYYALRELLAGRVRILCDAHNAVKIATNPGEALLALLNRSPFEGRKKEAK